MKAIRLTLSVLAFAATTSTLTTAAFAQPLPSIQLPDDPENAAIRPAIGLTALGFGRGDGGEVVAGALRLQLWVSFSQHWGIVFDAMLGAGDNAGERGFPVLPSVGLGYRDIADVHRFELRFGHLNVFNESFEASSPDGDAMMIECSDEGECAGNLHLAGNGHFGLPIVAEYGWRPGTGAGVPSLSVMLGANPHWDGNGNFDVSVIAGVGALWRFPTTDVEN